MLYQYTKIPTEPSLENQKAYNWKKNVFFWLNCANIIIEAREKFSCSSIVPLLFVYCSSVVLLLFVYCSSIARLLSSFVRLWFVVNYALFSFSDNC